MNAGWVDRLKSGMREAGITQEMVAERIGKKRQAVSASLSREKVFINDFKVMIEMAHLDAHEILFGNTYENK
ncbi:MAG: helix-turn-helix transcriptional regulator [Magnetococcales bacterium]|nr:helix-turn-helix transcriptional regulator [Magnetococcales bacterium]